MKNVMIVEDESLVALEISESVEAYGFEVVGICSDGAGAVAMAQEHMPDLVLMDISLKGDMDGITAAEAIMRYYRPAIIFLTAFSDEHHIERAVSLHPLGYLIKPIHTRELYALLKMATLQQNDTVRGDLILDAHFSIESATGALIKDGCFVKLTKREHQLLKLLIGHRNGILSIYEMELALWPEKSPNASTRRSLVNRLRAKLDNRFLETVHSEGYRLVF